MCTKLPCLGSGMLVINVCQVYYECYIIREVCWALWEAGERLCGVRGTRGGGCPERLPEGGVLAGW